MPAAAGEAATVVGNEPVLVGKSRLREKRGKGIGQDGAVDEQHDAIVHRRGAQLRSRLGALAYVNLHRLTRDRRHGRAHGHEVVDGEYLLAVVRGKLHDSFGIDHLTIQMETVNRETEALYVCETGTKCFEPAARSKFANG